MYGRVVGPSAAALTEIDIISGAYARVKALVDAAGAHTQALATARIFAFAAVLCRGQ
jgi:hypothetical protein